jgi:hypothetical protein
LRLRNLRLFLIDDLSTELDAFVADIDLIRPRDQPANLFLSFVAERTPVMHPPASR